MAAELPTGTVTFLFTDIEGSTQLLQELGEAYPRVQDEHHAILRKAVEDEHGDVVRTEGDSFFVAFRSPLQAVRAAVAAQRGLAAHAWSHGRPLRVRMGIHTGEGILGGDDYVGIDVNRAARIEAAAHGGQILLSDATRGLVEHALEDDVSVRVLGEHRLKDIAHPERLHDLAIEGLPSDFPPPRTLDARPNNLPAQLTSFVGREEEIGEVSSLLERNRFLTLTGPGGTGKSRLALQVAAETLDRYSDGAFFVDLSPVTDPALVPSAIGTGVGVPDRGGAPVIEALKEYLASKELLLLIDNFEQVVDAAPAVGDLLAAAPKVTVLLTSRVALSQPGEQEYPVPPLELPDPERLPDLPTLCAFEAVRLFTERAVAVTPAFRVTEDNAPAVAEITARLDGLPLAIELAANRAKVLSPEQMASRLDQRLSLSGARPTPGRRTLRDVIAWSHDLLGEEERALFARLSVFAGGWTLESAEAERDPKEIGIDIVDGLTSLVDRSLVRRMDAGGEARFTMLETIREFGLEQLQARGELDAMRRRHALHFLDLAQEAEPHLESDPAWLDRCDREHPNLRAALRWAIDEGDADRAQTSAGALWRFWHLRAHLSEARRWLEEVKAMPSGQGRTHARAKALTALGGIAWWQADLSEARDAYEEALGIERTLGDPKRIAEALYNLAHPILAMAMAGPQEAFDARLAPAVKLLEESLELYRRSGDEAGTALVSAMLAGREAMAGDWETAIARTEESVAIWRRLGNRFHLVDDLVGLAFSYAQVGRLGDATAAALEALDISVQDESPIGTVGALLAFASLANREARYVDAMRLLGSTESLRERAGGGPPTDFVAILVGNPEEDARAKLSKEAADRAWEEGKTMSTDEALALARKAPDAT